MSAISTEIISQLDKAFREKSFDAKDSVIRIGQKGSFLFEWRSEDVHVKGELLEHDNIGMMVSHVVIEMDRREESETAASLKTSAEAIEKRVNYLMEPLRIVEIDNTSNAVQIRSEKPQAAGQEISYFEIVLRAGKWFGRRDHVSIHRYAQRPEEEKNRRSIGFPLTKQQFERLLGDLIDAM
jgi:hypothetical protein